MHDSTIVRPVSTERTSVYPLDSSRTNNRIEGTEQTLYLEHGTRGPQGEKGDTGVGVTVQTFTAPGTLTVYAGKSRFYCSKNFFISAIQVAVGTTPTGSSVIVDVNKNGSTIFTNQSNRPTIPASSFVDFSSTPDIQSLLINDYLTVDIDQIGSTIAGSDLTVIITLEES